MVGVLCGCEDEKATIFVPEPVITALISASTDSTDSGGVVTLIAFATTSGSDPLTFNWSADQGSFSSTTNDTTQWTAPENPGLYDVAVVVTDGRNVAIATKMIGVETYVPAVHPFYRGAVYCQSCHGDEHSEWINSAHARAWNTLEEIGQERNQFCLQCHTVGSRGLNADPDLDNGGYDETAVARLYGVQCENCHGPGSEHPNPDFGSVQVTLEPALCGSCHNDTHHPTFDEWTSSPHSGIVAEPAGRAACAKCHNGAYAGTYLNDPAGFQNPSAVTDTMAITCAVCHDPHGNSNPGNLRQASVTDVVLPDGTVVPEAGAGRLCMSCHNGRRTPENIESQIENGGRMGPHHSNQGDMLAGTGAYEDVAPGFPFTSSRHLAVRDGCVHCHTHPHEGPIVFTGHTFLPTVESCEECHGVISDFDQILAKEDFDGDLAIEGVQHEVEGLLALLRQAIIGASTSPEDSLALEQNFESALGDTNVTTRRQREAGYNYLFVDFDSSDGVHNTTYAVQLIQQSILAVNAGKMPRSAHILRE
jgi:hypothetical protein